MQTPVRSIVRATAIVLALSTAAVAAPVSAWPGEGGPERMPGKMIRQLDLDAEQQAEVAELMAGAREAAAADRERMLEIKAQLRDQADSFDAGTARALADELGQITARSTYRMTETRAAIHALLDEEQRSKLAAMEAQRGDHGRQHGKGAGKSGYPAPRGSGASDS